MRATIPFFLYLAAGATISHSQKSVPLDYSLEAGDISINDAETGINDIDTIHNGRPISVHVSLVWSENENATNSTNIIFWDMFIDDKLTASGSEEIDDSRNLPTSIAAGEGTVYSSGTHKISVLLKLDKTETGSERNYQSFNNGLSFMPLVVVLIFAMTTHMVSVTIIRIFFVYVTPNRF